MVKPKITIFTCSYNKPQYIQDAISSVLQQTYPNFEYIILENSTDGVTRNLIRKNTDDRIKIIDKDFSDEQRRGFYVESYLKNLYSSQARGQCIMYLADDDILEPNCFEEHIKEFERNKAERINFHGFKITYLGSKQPDELITASRPYGLDTDHMRPGARVDGGAVMFKKELLSIRGNYFSTRWGNAHISDAVFLNRLAQTATFHPIAKILHTKRITEISTHTFVDKAGNISSNRSRLNNQ